jgi:NitT/TauT family transport system permease protein
MIGRSDVAAVALLGCVPGVMLVGALGTFGPLSAIRTAPISLDPLMLPEYAIRSLLRMLAAMAASLVFTRTYGTLAAKSRRAGTILIPLLHILQSVPVLGYLSFAMVFFLDLFPGGVLGAELAAIFAIFTSQAWNMAFSFIRPQQVCRCWPRRIWPVGSGCWPSICCGRFRWRRMCALCWRSGPTTPRRANGFSASWKTICGRSMPRAP